MLKVRGAIVAAAMLAVSLVAASSAMAAPVFEKFKECPTEVPGVVLCQYGVTTSGEVAIGKTKVPITNPIVQQGGAIKTGNPLQPQEYFLFPAKNGESLSKSPQNVPGGLTGLINCTELPEKSFWEKAAKEFCKATLEHGVTEVTATTELAASEKHPALLNLHNLSEEEGTALILPVRIHLKNALLGNSCYIGSETNPIELVLTTGTTGAISGKRGHAETLEEKELVSLRLTENALVGNTFKVPVTEGCGEFNFFGIIFKGYLDSLVNSKLGLPSEAGKNVAKLEGELNSAGASEVVEAGF